MNSATRERDRAATLARHAPEEAALVARQIADPWFRCQALSYAALYSRDERAQLRVLDEAFNAGGELTEPNRQVTVSAWPLKAAALLGLRSRVALQTERLMRIIEREPSPVRRADALCQVFGAVVGADPAVAVSVIRPFRHCMSDAALWRSPKQKR
jgi:hypothetical protein